MSLLIYNIRKIVQTEQNPVDFRRGEEMSILDCVDNGYIWIIEGRIHEFGTFSPEILNKIRNLAPDIDELDAEDGMVFPSWVDSHTHMVYAGSREAEFVDRIKGLSYQDIAARGGGILNSAQLLRDTPEEQLFQDAFQRLNEIVRSGTGAVEIKKWIWPEP